MTTEVLTTLSSRAVLEFEDVQQKYKEYFDKFQQEEGKKRRLEAQFKQLKQVSLLAVAEYESLHKQYLTENQYRKHIEEKLRKVTEENQEIRKQTKLGANTTIVNPVGNGGVQETKGELEVLRAMKEAINNELRTAKNEVTKLKHELLAEQKAHEVARNQLELGQKQMKQLNRVSVLALNEYTDLKKKFVIEETNRKTAEDVATEVVQKQQVEERKLSIINETAEKDDQVKRFLEEIDKLNATVLRERKDNSDKMKELEDELVDVKETGGSKELEEKVNLLMGQLDISQKEVVEATSRAEKSEYDTRQLYVRLAQAERLIDSSKTVPLPPPPPPPPPPIAAPVIRKFISRIGKGRRRDLPKEQEEDPRIEAMTAMIDRIKKGVKLRSVASPAKPPGEGEENQDEGAMGELAGLLSNMKRGRRGTEDSIDLVEEKPEPEFARFKLKKTGSVQSNNRSIDDSSDPSSELRRKLEKQKSVADGIAEVPVEENVSSSSVDENKEFAAKEDVIKVDEKDGQTEDTTPSTVVPEETTPPAVQIETTPLVVTEETTPTVVTEDTTPLVVPEETAPPAVQIETTPLVVTEETTPTVTPPEDIKTDETKATNPVTEETVPDMQVTMGETIENKEENIPPQSPNYQVI